MVDLLDKYGLFRVRFFREFCVFYRGNYVKVKYKKLIFDMFLVLWFIRVMFIFSFCGMKRWGVILFFLGCDFS